MPRTRWTRQRVFRLGFLVGRGFKAPEIASDPLIVSTAHTVRTMTGQMGGAFSEVPRGNLMIDLPCKLLTELEAQAKRRQQTTEALASMAMRILADDPTLLANVLDDGE